MDETPIWIIIVLVTIGFFALAAVLLVPVYRFLLREEEAAKEWVEDTVGKNKNSVSTGDGMAGLEPDPRT